MFSDVNTGAGIQVSGTYQPLVGNFGGDTKSDILWYAPGSTPDSLWIGTATHGTFTKMPMTINGSYIPLVGNFAGDGYDDILWYSPGTGADTLWTSIDAPSIFASSTFTINGTYTPVVLHNHPGVRRAGRGRGSRGRPLGQRQHRHADDARHHRLERRRTC